MTKRLGSLDGLRGVLALLVVISHMTQFLPVGDWSIGTGLFGSALSALLDLPFRSGLIAVFVFFAISGVVIAGAAERHNRWPHTLVSRYFRLSVPMAVATTLSWMLLQMFPGEMSAAADYVALYHKNHWTGDPMDSPAVPLSSALLEAFWTAYVHPSLLYFDTVLWTMRAELFGSFGIFTLYFFVPARFRRAMLVAWIVLLLAADKTTYLGFPIGALIYEFNARRRIVLRNWSSLSMIGIAIGFAVFMNMPEGRYIGLRLTHPVPRGSLLTNILFSVAAALVVIAAMGGPAVGKAMTCLPSRFLGRISYSLYLLHPPILFTAFLAFYRWLAPVGSPMLLIVWAVSFLIFMFAISWLMAKFVDEPITKLVKVPKLQRAERRDVPA